MTESTQRSLAAAGLVVGGLLGLAGSFVASPVARSIAWGIDGAALILAAALLTVYYLRQREDTLAVGYLIFLAGQTLVASTARMDLIATIAPFGAGVGLWAMALVLICVPRHYPAPIRILGLVASALFTVTALQVLAGHPLTPLARPLPFFAYPFFVATLFGIAWTLIRK